MQRENRRTTLVREWLEIADQDVQAAARLLQPEPIVRGAAYHCQQSMEKALKGFLTWHQINFPWTHNLEQLLLLSQEIDSEFGELLPTAEFLSPFATVPRYPADSATVTFDDAAVALRIAREALTFVRDRLPDDVQS